MQELPSNEGIKKFRFIKQFTGNSFIGFPHERARKSISKTLFPPFTAPYSVAANPANNVEKAFCHVICESENIFHIGPFL